MADRELRQPSDEQRRSDRELIEALEARRPVGERDTSVGETPLSVGDPTMPTDPGVIEHSDPTPVRPLVRRRPWRRRIAVAVAVVIAAIAAYGLFSYWQVWSVGRSDQARPVDAIVVLGAAQYDGRPSPQLAARLDHVVELWPQGLAPIVVVTGGNRPGDRFTEADASAAYLVERGVPAEAIRRESTGASTYDSLENVADLLGDTVQSVLIVTDPYHALRSRLVAESVGFDAYVSPTPTSVVSGAAELRRNLGEAAGVAVGRIIGFERLDDVTG